MNLRGRTRALGHAVWRRRLLAPLLLLCLAPCAAAQGQSSRYVYDEDGRLRAVIAPGGEAAVYEYDAAGNFTAVRRLGPDALEVLAFSPRAGLPGTRVVFYGVGFGPGVPAVTFGGGAAAAVAGFTANTITAVVPEGTVTGPVTISTARGTLVTADPFVVQGIAVSPREASVFGEEVVQFAAEAVLPGDEREIAWSVNGVEGGSDAIGRITDGGLYTAPPDPPASFQVLVEARSVAFPATVGTAGVRVRGFVDFRFTVSPGVSVGKGEAFSNASAYSRGVSIGKGEGYTFGAALSRGVAVGKGDGITNASAFSPGVTLTNGPVVASVSPGSVAGGSTADVTLGGTNFGGASDVRLFNSDGSLASDITATVVSVSGNGNSMIVTLNVAPGAAAGRRVVVVTTPKGHSVLGDVTVNTVRINAP